MSTLIPQSFTRRSPSRRAVNLATAPLVARKLLTLATAPRWGMMSLQDRKMMNFFVTVGTQRTGSHMLAEIMRSNPAIGFGGEIFSPGTDGFDKYAKAHDLPRPQSYRHAEQQFIDFVKHFRTRFPAEVKAYGFDIKYSQMRALTPRYEPLCSLPAVVEYLRLSGTRIIHIVRDNVLQTALSEVMATARAVWHHQKDEAINEKVTVDCRRLVRIMQEKRADRQIFASLMEGHGRLITCEYERMVRGLATIDGDGKLTGADNPVFEIADFLGVPRTFNSSLNLKKIVQKPYRDLIANYDEVLNVVRRTEFITYIDTI